MAAPWLARQEDLRERHTIAGTHFARVGLKDNCLDCQERWAQRAVVAPVGGCCKGRHFSGKSLSAARSSVNGSRSQARSDGSN